MQTVLGEMLTADAKRDAIHVAVAPVTSAESLTPGEHVGLVVGSTDRVTRKAKVKVGIVDPYLRQDVRPGQRFYVCLYPGTVTSLRHEWTHPAFAEEEEYEAAPVVHDKPSPTRGEELAAAVQARPDDAEMRMVYADFLEETGKPAEADRQRRFLASKEWLSMLADEVGRSYAALIGAADNWVDQEDYWTGGSDFEGVIVDETFWRHYDTVTGRRAPEQRRQNFFNCSC